MNIEEILDTASAVLLIAATAIMALGVVGVLRMPDVYTRVQASSKTSTLGLAIMFIGIALHFGELGSISRALAVVAFAFLSIPVAAHMITRAAHATGINPWPEGATDELRRDVNPAMRELEETSDLHG